MNSNSVSWSLVGGICLLMSIAQGTAALTPANSGDGKTSSEWPEQIKQMKLAPKGPFGRIRWFCADGSVLPPKPYACSELGGGKQHGEWTAAVKTIRAAGLPVATVYASLGPDDINQLQANPDEFAFLLLERYLINSDDGWIFRNAYSYRGALQIEDEIDAAGQLLTGLLTGPDWRDRNFLLLRDGFKLLPRNHNMNLLQSIRKDAIKLAELDAAYADMRNKLHNQLEPSDARTLRKLAAKSKNTDDAAHLEALAVQINAFFKPKDISPLVSQILPSLSKDSALFKKLNDYQQAAAIGPVPLAVTALALQQLRVAVSQKPLGPITVTKLMDLSLALEQQLLAEQAALPDAARAKMTRQEHLTVLHYLTVALYGTGLLDAHSFNYVNQLMTAQAASSSVDIAQYRKQVEALARVPAWTTGTLRLHYQPALEAMTTIEPKAGRFYDDAIRSSLALPYARILDLLAKDVSHLSGVSHQVFGKKVEGGILRLNPGLTRGPLFSVDHDHVPDNRNIALVTDASLELPGVAGILSGFDGNQLSHLQLLARNLGIPNAVISPAIVAQLQAFEGRSLVYGASPGGVVVLAEDSPSWDQWFPAQAKSDVIIEPDLNKLNLNTTRLIPLSELRAADSGRIIGPKAAKLGELKHLFPDAVTEGIAIPFGVFNQLLQKPIDATGKPTIQYMREQYAYIASLEKNSDTQKAVIKQVLQTLRDWFLVVPLDPEFEQQLRQAMVANFGNSDNVGVFVRSDTNVEDLPGFTGAGLNLTLPNVIGYDAVIQAMRRVWASPFSERAYSWRQALMPTPEHVYTAILLLKSVNSDRSGVLVTADADSNDRSSVTIAVNEGVGGAVDNQAAEVIVVNRVDQTVQLIQPASAARKKVIAQEGGLTSLPSSKRPEVLNKEQIAKLLELTDELPSKFPEIVDAAGNISPADVEFGFVGNRLVLFQIRPFLQNKRALQNQYLTKLDQQLIQQQPAPVNLLQPVQGQ